MILMGENDAGKAALLDEIARVTEDSGLLVSHITASSRNSIAHLLYPEILKVLQYLSTVEAASRLANRGLGGLHGFAITYHLQVDDLSSAIEPEPGLADSGIIEYDLIDLFEVTGLAAKAAARGWALLAGELHCLSEPCLSALIGVVHRVSQSTLPILLIGTGDPDIARLAGDAKPYAERLFQFSPITD